MTRKELLLRKTKQSTKTLVIVPSTPITIGITVAFKFHSFITSQTRSRYLSLFAFFYFHSGGLPGQQSPPFGRLPTPFLLLTITRSNRLAEKRWFVCHSKSLRSLRISFSRTDSALSIYHLFVWSDLDFLHSPQRITFPTQSCVVLYSFCANLLHSLII